MKIFSQSLVKVARTLTKTNNNLLHPNLKPQYLLYKSQYAFSNTPSRGPISPNDVPK